MDLLNLQILILIILINCTMKNLTTLVFFAFLSILTIMSSCKKEEPSPEIPSVSTFKIDYSDFNSASDTNATKTLDTSLTYHNWGYSFVKVTVWNVITTFGMALPVAAFTESFNHTAVYNSSDENWTWSYNIPSNNTAELTASLDGDSILWAMKINDFEWYTGKSHTNRSGGYWILNESVINQNPLLRITWHRNADGTSDIKYLNIKPNGAENGGYIHYGITNDNLNHFYDIYNKGADKHTNIKWNSTSKNGQVKDELEFSDSNWHCWGTNLADTDCN